MYTLRRILEDGYEYNFNLGKDYTLVRKNHVSQDEWDALSKTYWGDSYEKQIATINDSKTKVPERDCYGFVRSEDFTLHFLLPWQQNYIMTESGKTFAKL